MGIESHEKQGEQLRGFTLIELMAVIAVMTLLMGILLPVLGRVRKQARAVKCMSRLRQWGVVAQTYAADHGGTMQANPIRGWILILVPFLDEPNDLLLCPEAVKPGRAAIAVRTAFDTWRLPGRQGVYIRGSYGNNAWAIDRSSFTREIMGPAFFNNDSGFDRFVAKHWSRPTLKHPASIPFLFDCVSAQVNPEPHDRPPQGEGKFSRGWTGAVNSGGWGRSSDDMNLVCVKRHPGARVNMTFTDGSTRRVGIKELWTLKWHVKFDTTGPWTRVGSVQPEAWPDWMRDFKDY